MGNETFLLLMLQDMLIILLLVIFQDVPVVVVFKAMGIECEQEIVQLVGCEEGVISTFAPSLEECHKLNIYTQLQVFYSFINEVVQN